MGKSTRIAIVAVAALMAAAPEEAAAQRFPRAARVLDRLRPPVSRSFPPPIVWYSVGPLPYDVQVDGPFQFSYRLGLAPEFGVRGGSSDAQSAEPAPALVDPPVAQQFGRDPRSIAPPEQEELPAGTLTPSSRLFPATTPADSLSIAKRHLSAASYEVALRALHEHLANQPRDAQAMLLTSHALFALEAFPQAAETLRAAVAVAPKKEWGEVVLNYRRYFASPVEYADRLRALEAYTAQHPDQAAGHLLLGYHYGYLGLRFEAIQQLERATTIDPNDTISALLADEFRQSPAPPPIQPVAPGIKAAPTQDEEPEVRPEGPLLVRPVDT